MKAVTIPSKRAVDVWFDFVEGWAEIYVVYPDVISLEQESTFRSEYIRSVTEEMGIELQLFGVESHNSRGTGEGHHAPLRMILKIN